MVLVLPPRPIVAPWRRPCPPVFREQFVSHSGRRPPPVPAVLKQDDELELTLPEEDDFSAIRDIGAEEFNTLSRTSDFTVVVGYLPCELNMH